jgi:hypothetical protein
MDPNKIADWIQITATLGVLIGIVLVVLELRQAKAIAHADITANFFSETAQNNRVQMGENPAVVLAKACLRPNEVTAEELFVLEGFFGSRWSLADRTHRLELVGEFDTPWEEVARKSLQAVVRFEHGRNWLAEHAATTNPSLAGIVSELLKKTGNKPCEDSLNYLRLDLAIT